jgi:hypothetical protein
MPIPGIYASQISGHLFAPSGAYDSLASVTLSASASSITFAGIPSGYKHLQLRAMSMCVGGATINGTMYFNSDSTGTNYYSHNLTGNGSSAAAGAYNFPYTPFFTGSSTAPQSIVMDFLDYSNVNKNKTVRILSGYDANGSGNISLTSQLWNNTAAISSIAISTNGGNWAQYSSFALYGVK